MPEIIKLRKRRVVQKQKRVAAYCRVSTLHEDQEGSFTFQVDYYNQKIASNPEWEFAGVYGDHGVSGTSTHSLNFSQICSLSKRP